MSYRWRCLYFIASITCLNLLVSTAGAGTITETNLASYSSPFVFDFEAPALGDISGTDSYFTANGISSITAVSTRRADTYNSFAPSTKGLFHNQNTPTLLIDDLGGVARPFSSNTVFRINLSEAQHRIGFEILDQEGSDYRIQFFNGVAEVGTITFDYATTNVIRYFHNTDLFDSVSITGIGSQGYGLDNITIQSVAGVPEPASMAIWGISALGMGWVTRRKKRLADNS